MAFVQSFNHMFPITFDRTHQQQSSSYYSSPTNSNSSTLSLEEEEDDLSNLFQSDSFSLESLRDKELKSLSNLLQLSLGGSTQFPPSSSSTADTDSTSGSSLFGATGMGGYNPTNSFNNNSQSAYAAFNTQPLYPSSSSNQEPNQTTHRSTPNVTPSILTCPLPSTTREEFESTSFDASSRSGEDWSRTGGRKGLDPFDPSSLGTYTTNVNGGYNSATPSSSYTLGNQFEFKYQQQQLLQQQQQHFTMGCRAPAVSRERAPVQGREELLPSYQQSLGQPEEDDDDAMED